MIFEKPLKQGKFLRRYKRFFADIDYNGERLVAHCPNTGSMRGCQEEGAPCLFSTNDDPKRKLKYTLEMIKTPESWVGVHTGRPNALVKELWQNQPLPHWKQWDRCQMEVKINDKSRLDMMLWSSTDHDVKKWKAKSMVPPAHLIEIKNVTMRDGDRATFPDAVTTRGQKHVEELIHLQKKGFSTEMVFVIGRQDCKAFAPADSIDPEYGQLLRLAIKKGVQLTAVGLQMNNESMNLTGETLPIEL